MFRFVADRALSNTLMGLSQGMRHPGRSRIVLQFRRASRAIFWSAAALCLITVVGCGGNNGPKLVPVSGLVADKTGEPVANISLLFHPAKGPAAMAETDVDGKFTLRTGDRIGAVTGTHTVTATTRYASVHPETGAKNPLSSVVVPLRYSNPEQTPWKISIPGPVSDLELELEP